MMCVSHVVSRRICRLSEPSSPPWKAKSSVSFRRWGSNELMHVHASAQYLVQQEFIGCMATLGPLSLSESHLPSEDGSDSPQAVPGSALTTHPLCFGVLILVREGWRQGHGTPR